MSWQHTKHYRPSSGKPASGIPASGIPAGGPGQGPPSGMPASGLPATSMPPTHGARSPRVYGALAELLAAGLLTDRPDLAGYPEAVAAWATAEAQAALLRRHLAEVGPIDPETGEPRPSALGSLRSFEKLAAEHRATLGLDPRSEASLARERAAAATLTVDLAGLVERGRAALAARGDVPALASSELLREPAAPARARSPRPEAPASADPAGAVLHAVRAQVAKATEESAAAWRERATAKQARKLRRRAEAGDR